MGQKVMSIYVAGSGLTAEQEQYWQKTQGRFLPTEWVDETVLARLSTHQEAIIVGNWHQPSTSVLLRSGRSASSSRPPPFGAPVGWDARGRQGWSGQWVHPRGGRTGESCGSTDDAGH